MRTEKDIIGSREIPADALYGIHALRASEHFPGMHPFPLEWYKALGMVKCAYYRAAGRFSEELKKEGLQHKFRDTLLPEETASLLEAAATEVSQGLHYAHFIVPGLNGGAGTSINMNINEIIANLALLKAGDAPGDYSHIDPIHHANIYQSTNDVVPSALRLAVMLALPELEEAINLLRKALEEKENLYRNDLRLGYTQMQAAVPTSWGRLFSSYSEALSRDWWRISRCQERIKVLNLGAGASGTGLSIPRFVIVDVIKQLQQLTGLPLSRSENLADATANHDSLVEVHGMLKALAVNLEKMAADLRMLAAGTGHQEISLPALQAGSSIMPGKVNPVIPEYVISIAHQVYANDQLITSLSAQGTLELNAYIPLIGKSLLESLRYLIHACRTMEEKMIQGLVVDTEKAERRVWHSPSITTAFIPYIGYHQAGEIAALMKERNLDVFEAAQQSELVSEEVIRKALRKESLLKLGYSVKDL
jgi:aspartate ammonia-lyase